VVSRDKIAVDNGLSAGAVTNTVNEWRLALGFSAADGLRFRRTEPKDAVRFSIFKAAC